MSKYSKQNRNYYLAHKEIILNRQKLKKVKLQIVQENTSIIKRLVDLFGDIDNALYYI